MKEFKGTKGKWEVKEKPNGVFSICCYDMSFAEVYCNCSSDEKNGECEANAKLIAAAPELLEALEEVTNGFEWRISSEEQPMDKADFEMYDKCKSLLNKILD